MLHLFGAPSQRNNNSLIKVSLLIKKHSENCVYNDYFNANINILSSLQQSAVIFFELGAQTNQNKWWYLEIGFVAKIWNFILKLFLCVSVQANSSAWSSLKCVTFTEKKVIQPLYCGDGFAWENAHRERRENKLLYERYKSTASVCVSFTRQQPLKYGWRQC